MTGSIVELTCMACWKHKKSISTEPGVTDAGLMEDAGAELSE